MAFPKVRKFTPVNTKKYLGNWNAIYARSSWELKFLRWCDTNAAVIKYNSEDVVVPYWSSAEQKMRNYHIDFYLEYHTNDGKRKQVLIEIKPHAQTLPPKKGRKDPQVFLNEQVTYQVNQDKWAAAKEFAKSNGMEFVVFTEYELGIAKPMKVVNARKAAKK